MVKLNKEDYRKIKHALEFKDFVVLKDLNLGEGIIEDALINALKANAYAGASLEEPFGPFELTDGPTEFVSREEVEANVSKLREARICLEAVST